MKSHFFVFFTAALHFDAYARDFSTVSTVVMVYRYEAYIESGVGMEIQKGTTKLNFSGLLQGIDLNGAELQQANGKESWMVRPEPGSTIVLPYSYSGWYPKNLFINLPR